MYQINGKQISYSDLMTELSACETLVWDNNKAHCLLRTHNEMPVHFYNTSHANLKLYLFKREEKYSVTCSIESIDDSDITFVGPLESHQAAQNRLYRLVTSIVSWNGRVPTLTQVREAEQKTGTWWTK
jgi:hypothetical protein